LSASALGREKTKDASMKPWNEVPALSAARPNAPAPLDGDTMIVEARAADVREMTASGVVALQLLRASRSPVWLKAHPACRGGRIVAAVNLCGAGAAREHLNDLVVRAAARLSRSELAELHVVGVADHSRDRVYESLLSPAQYQDYFSQSRGELQRSLHDLIARLAPYAVPHLVEGNALDALEKLMLELGADIVTLGRDDRDARAEMPGVYFAEQLFCRIDRSVLVVGIDGEAAETPRGRPFGQPRMQPLFSGGSAQGIE
jgi:hypothetical protein